MSNLSPSIISDLKNLNVPLCVVCDDAKSEGQHFGQYSCKACAAFFRRTVSYKNNYECKIDKQCKISKDIRNICRFCRFQKCLEKGMLPNLVQGHRDSYGKRTTLSESPVSVALTENREEEMKLMPQMLKGYTKFLSIRKASCDLLINETYSPNSIPHSKYSNAKKVMQMTTNLCYEMIMEYFLPFSTFAPEDQKILFHDFAVLFDNAEKSYNTFKAYGYIKNNDKVILADGGYIKLDETYKFFINSMDVSSDPQQLAKIFLQCFTYIAKVVVPAMTENFIDDFSMVAVYGLCLFKSDIADISDKTRETITKIREEIIREMHIYYRKKSTENTEITIKICKILLLIPTLEHVGRLFHENFNLVDLFSMLDVPKTYKN
uniref:Uncharacterized protein n=1 Tax=Panagrolaimus sp. PS1159 TaxID=55785 RepID=A0AC35GSA7_9BILA